ncbi:MAG: hypothetical protein H7A33_05670 [Deltaproteobacteria bacterium]|nr:hypothetical protein [Deltaproteobacteria bacterium]
MTGSVATKQTGKASSLTKVVFFLLVVFASLTTTYIYNEVQEPSYQAVAQAKLIIPETAGTQRFQSYYSYQSIVKEHMNAMRSPQFLEALNNNPLLIQVLEYEKKWRDTQSHPFKKYFHQDNPVGETNLVERIIANTAVHYNEKNDRIQIVVTDTYSKFATVVANLVAKLYQQHLEDLVPSEKIQTEMSLVKQDVAQSLPAVLDLQDPKEQVHKNTKKLQARLQDLQTRQTRLLLKQAALKQLLKSKSFAVPSIIQDSELLKTARHLAQKRIDKNAVRRFLKRQTALTQEIAFLEEQFHQRTRHLLKTINDQISHTAQIQDTIKKAMINPELGLDFLPEKLDETAALFAALLKQNNKGNALHPAQLLITDPAQEPEIPSVPNKTRNLILSLIISSLSALLVLQLKEIFTQKINVPEEPKSDNRFRILGVMP